LVTVLNMTLIVSYLSLKMNDPKILVLISKYISNEVTVDEKKEFTSWLNENIENAILFEKIKNSWLGIEEKPTPFFKKIY
jgi:hypothetical protein